VNIANRVKKHPDFAKKYKENSDNQNKNIAFNKIFDEVMVNQRKNELDLYKLISQDEAFKVSFIELIKRLVA